MGNRQFQSLTIAGVRAETEHAIRIRFTVPEDLREVFNYSQGQYLTLRSTINGESVRRSYSVCSGIRDAAMEIAIKRVAGGVFSNYANDSLQPGDVIEVMPPQGGFFTELDPEQSRNYLFIAAGSGITPVISNIRSILEVETCSRVTLLYGNQRSSTIMFREDLSFLKNRFMQRFHWINILSREDQGADVLNGRLDNRKGGELNQRLLDLQTFDDYFICGPESMMSEVSRGLLSVGVKQEQIHVELFASSAEEAQAAVRKHQARVREYGGKLSQVTIVMDGRASRFELSADGENILDAGLNHGVDLPYSCKGGVCATCKAKLVEGRVDMDLNSALEPEDIESGFILTCQSHPISDSVVLDFDQK